MDQNSELFLIANIDVMKDTLANIVNIKGVNSPEAIEYRQELDKLLNLQTNYLSNYEQME